jgi:hypothetical protein
MLFRGEVSKGLILEVTEQYDMHIQCDAGGKVSILGGGRVGNCEKIKFIGTCV